MYRKKVFRFFVGSLLSVMTCAGGCLLYDTYRNDENPEAWAEEGWEAAPRQELLPYPWDNLPKMTEEYTYRTTPANVERRLEGNFYPAGWPLVKEKVTLTFFGKDSIDENKNIIVAALEKKTNVHIEWQLVHNDQLEKEYTLLIASGDYPDVFWGCEFTNEDEMRYGVFEKVFIPLNELIRKYGYYTRQVFDVRPDVKRAKTLPDGAVYTLPCIFNDYHVKYPVRAWINTDWLDSLGLEMPQTIDEFHNVMRAFKDGDPNGNGMPDELPLTGAATGWHTNIMAFFMNPFILNMMDHHLVIDDGTVYASVDTSQYREGLRWLNTLYNEGLLDRDAFYRNGSTLRKLGMNDKAELVGCCPGGYFGVLVEPKSSPRKDHYHAVPPLEGPEGNAYTEIDDCMYLGGAFAITSSCKTPEVAFRWADWFYSPEGTRAAVVGRYGKEWDYAEKGVQNIFKDGQAVFNEKSFVSHALERYARMVSMQGPYAIPLEEHYKSKAFDESDDYFYRMSVYTRELYEGHEMPERFPRKGIYVPLDVAVEYNILKHDLFAYIDKAAAQFVTGALSIDYDWDKYLEVLESKGLRRYVQISNEVYEDFLRN